MQMVKESAVFYAGNDDDHCRDFLCGFTELLDCIAVIMEANQIPRVNYDASFPFDGSALVQMRLTLVPRTPFLPFFLFFFFFFVQSFVVN